MGAAPRRSEGSITGPPKGSLLHTKAADRKLRDTEGASTRGDGVGGGQ